VDGGNSHTQSKNLFYIFFTGSSKHLRSPVTLIPFIPADRDEWNFYLGIPFSVYFLTDFGGNIDNSARRLSQ
jgi:hypothetical protein